MEWRGLIKKILQSKNQQINKQKGDREEIEDYVRVYRLRKWVDYYALPEI